VIAEATPRPSQVLGRGGPEPAHQEFCSAPAHGKACAEEVYERAIGFLNRQKSGSGKSEEMVGQPAKDHAAQSRFRTILIA
jgi:hypothetical protein